MYTKFFETLLFAFLPLVHLYYSACSDLLFNVAREDAVGMEKRADELLIPYHFVFEGRSAKPLENGAWEFERRFPVDVTFWPKMGLSCLLALPSLVLGAPLKLLSFASIETRSAYASLQKSISPQNIVSHEPFYRALNIELKEEKWLSPQGFARSPYDLLHLAREKEALSVIVDALNKTEIPWWVDCGSCLGAYRYGGTIPWDIDIDLGFPLIEFDNVLRALSQLDPDKYLLEDWSSRDFPKSYLKLFVRETGGVIDLYFFKIYPAQRSCQYILALETNLFFPKWWKIREQPFKVETPLDVIFPLQKAMFDGIEVFVPHDPKTYLQMRYGENLDPVKLWNPDTNQYEKDFNHPYWQRAYVH